jgi:hypothetical protein
MNRVICEKKLLTAQKIVVVGQLIVDFAQLRLQLAQRCYVTAVLSTRHCSSPVESSNQAAAPLGWIKVR